MPSELTFKFRFVKSGDAKGLRSKKGAATSSHLILDGERLDYNAIVDTTTRDKRIVLVLDPEVDLPEQLRKEWHDQNVLVLEVYKVQAGELERYIDSHCSKREAEKRKRELEEKGQGHLFKSSDCPACDAVIDLSELSESRYIYCRYCETVFWHNGEVATRGDQYRICDECGLFGRVKGYTEFYFYFLLVVYGFYSKRRFLCDNCVNRVFLKTLFVNLPFLLGIPASIAMKVKSLVGRDPSLRELTQANALARKGEYQRASGVFLQLHQKYSEHPGLYLNEGMAYLNGGQIDSAVNSFRRSLESCSNYLPTARVIRAAAEE